MNTNDVPPLPYPHWRYHASGQRIVQNAEEEARFTPDADGWSNTPVGSAVKTTTVPAQADPVPVPPSPPAPEPTPESAPEPIVEPEPEPELEPEPKPAAKLKKPK